jgi:hypothetical protein
MVVNGIHASRGIRNRGNTGLLAAPRCAMNRLAFPKDANPGGDFMIPKDAVENTQTNGNHG